MNSSAEQTLTQAADMARHNFFRVVGFSKCLFGLLFDAFFTLLAFAPELIPFPTGSSFQNLVENHNAGLVNFWWFLFGLHVAEACLALRLCTEKGVMDGRARLLWFLQTLFFGYFSMEMLFDFYPEKQKHK